MLSYANTLIFFSLKPRKNTLSRINFFSKVRPIFIVPELKFCSKLKLQPDIFIKVKFFLDYNYKFAQCGHYSAFVTKQK